jgi:hypothetical protein
MNCDDVRSLAAELAAGVLSGEERAAALAHVAECPACREEVASLAERVDGVLLLAPGVEPPAGFESRVIGALGGVPGRGRGLSRGRPLLALAAAAVLVLLLGVALGRLSHSTPNRPAPVAAMLAARDGKDVGQVVWVRGEPGWLVVDVHGLYDHDAVVQNRSEDYLVELDLGAGRLVRSGAIRLLGGKGSARIRLAEGEGALAAVRLVTRSGDQSCEARFT